MAVFFLILIHYHEIHIGQTPVHDDQELFAKLVLDMNQAGLSWSTILNKQESFYKAYDQFEIEKVASYSKEKEEELRQNAGNYPQQAKDSSCSK